MFKPRVLITLAILFVMETQALVLRRQLPTKAQATLSPRYLLVSAQSNGSTSERPEHLQLGHLRSTVAAVTVAVCVTLVRPTECDAAFFTPQAAPPTSILYSKLLDEIAERKVALVTISPDERSALVQTTEGSMQRVALIPSVQKELLQQLISNSVPFSGASAGLEQNADGVNLVGNVIGAVVQGAYTLINIAFPFVAIYYFLGLRGRMKDGGGPPVGGGSLNPFDMLKSDKTAEMITSTGINFADVAGCDEAKFELEEVVDFLKNATKFDKVPQK